MAQLSDRDELVAAWRALVGDGNGTGWRTIAVASAGSCRLRAGRHFPGNEEAFLVGFTSIEMPSSIQLPQGQGFAVSWADLGAESEGRTWIALCKEGAGDLDLFSTMADDVRTTLRALRNADARAGLQAFLSRIRAWQDFMRKGADSLLSPEAEVGLFGELQLLDALVSAGLPAWQAIDCWQGPLDGLHDFPLGTGAIEVKSTASPAGFMAKIGSLEQLDDSLIRPLYLAAVRLAQTDSGRTLPEYADHLRTRMADDDLALSHFNSRLLHAGLRDAHAEKYTRRFTLINYRLIRVTDGFPRLTAGNVALPIRQAKYELDLDLVPAQSVELEEVLLETGVEY